MKIRMRLAARLAAILCLATGVSAAAAAPPQHGVMCLWSREISDTHIPDNQTIIFVMRDGTRWRTRLSGYCPALKTYGFSYRIPDSRICDRMIIHVNRTHTPCALGTLERLPGAPAK
jgi:ABC-type sugar transport system substrate-binding protein